MMHEREQIVTTLVELLDDFPEITTVTRVIKPLDALSPAELPLVFVIDGDETRDYQGRRMIAHFDVHLRIVDDRSQVNKTSSSINELISKIEKLLENNPYLNGICSLPSYIIRIDTDEGWLFPFSIATIVLRTTYTRIVNR